MGIFKYKRPYVRNKGKEFYLPYIPGENYSLYINFDTLPSDFSYRTSPFELWIIDTNGTHVVLIPGLTVLLVAGSAGYHLYNPVFVFPHIPNGYYSFQIWNPNFGGVELWRSNLINCNSLCIDNTSYVQFRHNDQLYGVRYDLLPDFYQIFRIPVNRVKALDISSTREQYRQSSEGRELRNSKSFRDIKQPFEFYLSNDEDHEAMSALLEHDVVYMNGERMILLDQDKVELPSEFSEQSKGTFNAIVDNYNKDYRTLEGYGDFMTEGLGFNNISTNFVDGGSF